VKGILLLALVLAVPGVSACQGMGQAVGPFLDLQFPEKQPCPRNQIDECPPVLADGESLVLEGQLRWWWDLDNCGAGSFAPSQDAVVVTFEPYERNPGFLPITIEPSSVTVSFEDQWDLTDDDHDPVAGTFTFQETYPVTATITRQGDPSGDDMDSLARRQGIAELMVKVRSSETELFDPSFTVEVFGFDARPLLQQQQAEEQEAPGVTPFAVLLALLAFVATRRR
jgi:hypothetical protein